MTRAEIIDIIKGLLGIRVDSLFTYKESYTSADMTPNTIPNWQTVQDATAGSEPVKITAVAGSPYPYNILATDFITITSLRPNVRQSKPGATDTQDTTEGANQLCRYNFADNTKTVLVSIDVLTTTADGVTVDVDTYIVISQ